MEKKIVRKILDLLLNGFVTSVMTLVLHPSTCFSQQEDLPPQALEQTLENSAASGDEETDLSELGESYESFLKNPLNINKAELSDLLESRLFNAHQAKAIVMHRMRFGDLMSLQELQVIDGMDEFFLRRIAPYITTGRLFDEPNATFSRMVAEGTHQLLTRMQFGLQLKKGFADENYPDYKGSPLALYTRYRFNFMRKLSWGIVADKDAGEQLFTGDRKSGFDFYSAHFAMRNVGPFAIFVVGDYQLEYGQGLTMSSGLSGGKPSDPVMIRKAATGIRPYTSSNEAFFKRGGAVSLKWKKSITDFFFSYRKVDANISTASDSTDASEVFTSLQESGYHRTFSEIADRKSITETFYGFHTSIRLKSLNIGATGVRTKFDKPFLKTPQPYNQFDFSGNECMNGGIDYNVLIGNIGMFGEVAVSQSSTYAWVQGVTMSLHPSLAVSFLCRNYPRNFQSLTASAFRESGNNANERGFYAGINLKPWRQLTILAALDRFRFPWLRYRTDAASEGLEWNATVTYQPSRKTELYVRVRETRKMINAPEESSLMNHLEITSLRGIRLHMSTKVSAAVSFRSRIEKVVFQQGEEAEHGIVLMQDFQYHPMGFPLSFNFRYAFFDTDSYDSRIYAYENDVLYGYSIPAYYYKGSRFYLNIRYKIRKGFDCWLRYAITSYTNRDVIGSGYDEIIGNKKEEIKIQFRLEW